MHFFNPPPLMQHVEVIRADQSADAAVAVAREVGEAMGKRVIMATDGPGFLVNRSGRPFASEALRIVQERIATPEQVDRICRLEGGFRMGPFELMDLVGIDVNLEVAKSFAELSFGEPRWRPNPLQARMVAAGRLGRKSGRGWYEYEDGKPRRPEDPDPPAPGDGDGRALAIHGDGPLAAGLRQRAAQAGFRVGGEEDAELIIDARPAKREAAGRGKAGAAGAPEAGAAAAGATSAAAAADAPPLLLCAGSSLAARRAPGAVGFHLLPPLDGCRLVELTGERESEQGRMAEHLFGALGFVTEWVGDAPGLVLGRIVCQLVNEACFAIGEGVGSAADVDAGLELGLNHPRGPVAWAEAISIPNVLAVIDGLWEERHEERYRAAPLLRRAAATGTLG